SLSIMLCILGGIGIQVPMFELQVAQANNSSWPNPVVVEWLEFRVPVEEQAEFLAKDEQIWTAALRQQPGFLHKSIWTSPDRPESVTLAIYWKSREDWFAFPEALIGELDRQMQPINAELVDSREFIVQNPAGNST
ncbi:MAG: TIGR03792 family protein, partial [Cyanobacteria bacterium P01_E01_bin.34]